MSKHTDKPIRGRPKTVDRERTIDLAMGLYWQRGLHALSLNEMCRHASISKPALYREFGGEDGLMEAALDRYRQLAVLPLLSLLDDERPFAEVLDRLIIAITTDRGTPDGCLFTTIRLAGPRLGPATEKRVRAIEAERRAAFEARLRVARKRGELASTLSPKLAARYLDNQLTLVLLQMAAGEPRKHVRAEARLALRALLPNAEPP